jgi:hypothetical protein
VRSNSPLGNILCPPFTKQRSGGRTGQALNFLSCLSITLTAEPLLQGSQGRQVSKQATVGPLSVWVETFLRKDWIFFLRETPSAIVRADNPVVCEGFV